MASEQEDERAQQLEALRRYVVRLDSGWEPPAQLGVQGERLGGEAVERGGRPPRRWLLITGLLVTVALVGGLVVGAVAWSDDRPASDATRATAPASTGGDAGPASAASVATPACKTAVDRANAMLASAVKLRGALAEQDRVLSDPANRDASVDEVLRRLAATQQVASSESATFDRALDAYRAVVDKCDLRAP
jgi:hypothetical protein